MGRRPKSKYDLTDKKSVYFDVVLDAHIKDDMKALGGVDLGCAVRAALHDYYGVTPAVRAKRHERLWLKLLRGLDGERCSVALRVAGALGTEHMLAQRNEAQKDKRRNA